MSGYDKYVEQAADEIQRVVYGTVLPEMSGERETSTEAALAALAAVGPLIEEDTRDRMVTAAGRAIGDDPFVTHYEWQAPCTTVWHPCAGKEQLVGKLERFGGRGRMRLLTDWDDFPDIEAMA